MSSRAKGATSAQRAAASAHGFVAHAAPSQLTGHCRRYWQRREAPPARRVRVRAASAHRLGRAAGRSGAGYGSVRRRSGRVARRGTSQWQLMRQDRKQPEGGTVARTPEDQLENKPYIRNYLRSGRSARRRLLRGSKINIFAAARAATVGPTAARSGRSSRASHRLLSGVRPRTPSEARPRLPRMRPASV
jgi:hypothetical protein